MITLKQKCRIIFGDAQFDGASAGNQVTPNKGLLRRLKNKDEIIRIEQIHVDKWRCSNAMVEATVIDWLLLLFLLLLLMMKLHTCYDQMMILMMQLHHRYVD